MRSYMRFLWAAAVLVIAATSARADCRSSNDQGATRCVAGVLYRCACTRSVGATSCSWDNAAADCSAISTVDELFRRLAATP